MHTAYERYGVRGVRVYINYFTRDMIYGPGYTFMVDGMKERSVENVRQVFVRMKGATKSLVLRLQVTTST